MMKLSVWARVSAFIVCMLLPAQAMASPEADERAAIAVVKAIYDDEELLWGRDVFTAQTQALFGQADAVDEMGLGFDPFVDGQDFELSPIRYSAQSRETGLIVSALFYNIGEPRDIRFDMVKTADGWKIADISSHDETGIKWRLSALLQEIIALGARRVSAENFVRGLYISDSEVASPEGKLTPELAMLFEEALAADSEGLNFNPFLDADRAEIRDIRFGSWLTDQGAFVEVEFINIIRPVYLIYEVRETDGGWRIADIVALSEGREKWRLTTLLNYLIANPVKAAS